MIKKLLLASLFCASTIYAQTFGGLQPIITPLSSGSSGSSGTVTNLIGTNGITVTAGDPIVISGQSAINTASNIALVMNNSRISTNTIGSTVNAITYGLIPDGITDNTVMLSNLLNSASSIYFPCGTYAHLNPIIINHPVNIKGDSATLRYTGSSNFYSLTFALSNAPGCTIDGMTFSPSQAAVSASGGMISLNCMGFAKVKNCIFLNTAGQAIFVSGDTNLQTRLNHYYISDNVFSNVYDGIVLDGSNKAEYGIVSGNRAHIVGRFGIKCASASVNIENNNFNGYTAPSPPLGAGIWLVPDNNRGHATVVGNTSHHFTFGIVVDQVTGSAGVVGNSFMGCVSNFIGGSSLITVVGNKFETTGTGNANVFTGLSSSVIVGNMFAGGNITGLTNSPNGYNWDFTGGNIMLPLTGNASGLTNLNLATTIGILPQGSLPSVVVTNNSSGVNLPNLYSSSALITNLSLTTNATSSPGSVSLSGGGGIFTNISKIYEGTSRVAIYGNTTTANMIPIYNGTSGLNGAANFTSDFSGNVAMLSWALKSGSMMTNMYLTNATLDFGPCTLAGDRAILTVNLTNVSVGDFVDMTIPPDVDQSTTAIGSFRCSATNGYIWVTFTAAVPSQDPPSGNYRFLVQKVK